LDPEETLPQMKHPAEPASNEKPLVAALALSLLAGIPLRDKVRLVRGCGDYQAALTRLKSSNFSPPLERAFSEYDGAKRGGFLLVDLLSPKYPRLLAAMEDPPLVLYVWGGPVEVDELAIAIVGSRRASAYGLAACHRFAQALARRGASVVSGLARGIDAAAHRAALEAGGRTIAVLGSGLNRLYPSEHRRLAEKIARNGAVISELPLEAPPLPGHFPMRNRVIAGMTFGTIVVEAAVQSGSLITARHALEQNREVFALPGSIDSPTTLGVHRLIQDGAKLITSVDDVLDELSPEIRRRLQPEKTNERPSGTSPIELVEDEEIVFNSLRNTGTADSDRLVELAGMPASRVKTALAGLRLKDVVGLLPGGFYWIKDGRSNDKNETG
jgi:DNA processing protein